MMIKLSQPQHTPAGEFLCFLYYRTNVFQMLKSNERAGYPHDGGEHSLLIFNDSDAVSFVDFVEEEYGTHPGCKEFVKFARLSIFKSADFTVSFFGAGPVKLV